jgi:hypothetical protein
LEAGEIVMVRSPRKTLATRRSSKPVDATEEEFIDRIYECAFLPEPRRKDIVAVMLR